MWEHISVIIEKILLRVFAFLNRESLAGLRGKLKYKNIKSFAILRYIWYWPYFVGFPKSWNWSFTFDAFVNKYAKFTNHFVYMYIYCTGTPYNTSISFEVALFGVRIEFPDMTLLNSYSLYDNARPELSQFRPGPLKWRLHIRIRHVILCLNKACIAPSPCRAMWNMKLSSMGHPKLKRRILLRLIRRHSRRILVQQDQYHFC